MSNLQSPNTTINPKSKKGKRSSILHFLKNIRISFLLFLGVLSVILGTIGYQKRIILTGIQGNFGSSLYGAFQLLQLNGGNLPKPIPWELEVARWLAPAVAMYTVLLGLTKLFRREWQGLRLKFISNHIIICGLGEKGIILARNFRDMNKRVAIIEKDANNPRIPFCDEIGVIVVRGDARDVDFLDKAGTGHASHLIIVCGNDGTNAEIAVRARQAAGERKGNTKLNCAVHLQDTQLWGLLRQQEFNAERTKTCRTDFFNVYDQGARQLLDLYFSIPENNPDKATEHILLVGLGNLGEQLVLNMARRWYSIFMAGKVKLRISVIEEDADKKMQRIAQKYSLVREVCELSTIPVEVGSIEFEKNDLLTSLQSEKDISQAYICTENETIGLSAAQSILKRTANKNLEILVRMNDDSGLASLLRGTQGTGIDFQRLHIYGLLEHTCKTNLLNDGSHEYLAREIHRAYVRFEERKGNTVETNRNMAEWEKLDEDIQEMNRDNADDIGYKLEKVGCDILPWIDFGANEFPFTNDEIETLAEMEHQRWCTLKLQQGWRYGPVKSETKKEHPSLIPWNDMRFSEGEKDKDRNIVRQIPQLLALAGFQIYRIRA
jgi:hypothetical protein